ncbi:MAG: hypothetical protein INF91_09340, partial [Alphaproteobacteria bacterium]|nr:hypothetical protein [Alphaproteobacteria bacterium]
MKPIAEAGEQPDLAGGAGGRRVRTERGDETLRHRPVHAARVGGADQRVLPERAREVLGEHAVGVAVVVVAVLDVVVDGERLMRVVTADQPVESVVHRRALEAQLLGEGLELAVLIGAAKDIERVEVRILAVLALVDAIGGDRRQVDVAELPVGLARQTHVRAVLVIVEARRDRRAVDILAILRGRDLDLAAERLDDVEELVRLARHIALRIAPVGDGARQIDRAAALLVLLAVVADDADREIVVRLQLKLAAHEIAVAVVEAAARDDIGDEAVALHIDAVDARRRLVAGDRPGDRPLEAHEVVVAVV